MTIAVEKYGFTGVTAPAMVRGFSGFVGLSCCGHLSTESNGRIECLSVELSFGVLESLACFGLSGLLSLYCAGIPG